MPDDLRLAGCGHDAAAFACRTWHYSRTVPAGKLVKIGVWEGGQFIGAVVFGRGANNNIGSRYGLRQTEICELVRVALKGHAAPVSRIVGLAVRLLRRQSPGLKLIVSYADPEQGHVGSIYQAGNWVYAGRSGEQRELLVSGQDMHKRSANSRWGTASPERLRALTGLQVEWGPSRWKHTYLMPMDAAARARIEPLRQPYPKKEPNDGRTRTAANADQDQEGPGKPRQATDERARGGTDRRLEPAGACHGSDG